MEWILSVHPGSVSRMSVQTFVGWRVERDHVIGTCHSNPALCSCASIFIRPAIHDTIFAFSIALKTFVSGTTMHILDAVASQGLIRYWIQHVQMQTEIWEQSNSKLSQFANVLNLMRSTLKCLLHFLQKQIWSIEPITRSLRPRRTNISYFGKCNH